MLLRFFIILLIQQTDCKIFRNTIGIVNTNDKIKAILREKKKKNHLRGYT